MGFVIVEMEVLVRKNDVDAESLKALLISHKSMSTKQIADILSLPETKVAHWFRSDKYFTVPDADIWHRLKDILGIQTDEFDRQITEFEAVGGVFDMRNRIYIGDISPTLVAGCGNDLYLIER